MFNLSNFLNLWRSVEEGGVGVEYVALLEGFARVSAFSDEIIVIDDDDNDDTGDYDSDYDDGGTTISFHSSVFRVAMSSNSDFNRMIEEALQLQREQNVYTPEPQQQDDNQELVQNVYTPPPQQQQDGQEFDYAPGDLQNWNDIETLINPAVEVNSADLRVCIICTELHSAVFAVSCGHTYCFVCAVKCINSGRCYTCRQEFEDNDRVIEIFLGERANAL